MLSYLRANKREIWTNFVVLVCQNISDFGLCELQEVSIYKSHLHYLRIELTNVFYLLCALELFFAVEIKKS